MERNPRTVAALTMLKLNESGQAPTPENFSRLFYEISVKPMSELGGDMSNMLSSQPCQEFVRSLKELVEETGDISERLSDNLQTKNRSLQKNAATLESSQDSQEILRLVASIVAEVAGIGETVNASSEELRQTRQAMHQLQAELEQANRMLGEDILTKTLNRRGLDNALAREVGRVKRSRGSLSLVMADLDHFKNINDSFGHEAGDRMIVHFAELIQSVLRQADALARFGGEEFVIVLPEADITGAQMLVHRLQIMMAKTPLVFGGKEITASFSAGIAQHKDNEEGVDLLRRADIALYAAKAAGRNCFRVAP